MTKVDKDQATSVVTLWLKQGSAFLREESVETPSLGVESHQSSFSSQLILGRAGPGSLGAPILGRPLGHRSVRP
ncbi:hypothetical protein CRG98_000589 [Punica granatum]|uniref:Uncharacterized protein n=1 Tax=Punica granatum TaxID=22663 RepID=A0A2I0LFL9_PUNGR|nr:hypothetical protein CRG98_000589 [Punica granatum]